LSFISRFRGTYYRIKYQYIKKKAVFGNPFHVSCCLKIKGPGKIIIGSNCYISSDAFGHNYVTLYTHDKKALIKISDNVILRGTRFGCYTEINIETGCVIESASIFDSDFHNIDANKRDEAYQQFNRPVSVGQKSYVGLESLIGKGTYIEHDTIVLPGSVLSGKRIKCQSIIAGIPARAIAIN